MQRKATKNTRAANAKEKSFHNWLSYQSCVTCGNSPVIVHHCEGATFKHNKTLIGHWFCLPLCQNCDDVITHGSRKAFRERFNTQGYYWEGIIAAYSLDVEDEKLPSQEEYNAIIDWGR